VLAQSQRFEPRYPADRPDVIFNCAHIHQHTISPAYVNGNVLISKSFAKIAKARAFTAFTFPVARDQ
jgi:hypothetical protein